MLRFLFFLGAQQPLLARLEFTVVAVQLLTGSKLAEYPNLDRYLQHILDIPGVRETVNIDHIKQGYYSIKALNPNGIVPAGPDLSTYGL